MEIGHGGGRRMGAECDLGSAGWAGGLGWGFCDGRQQPYPVCFVYAFLQVKAMLDFTNAKLLQEVVSG